MKFSATLCAFLAGVLLVGCAALQQDDARRADLIEPRKIIALVPDARAAARMRAATQAAGYREIEIRRLDGLGLTMMSYRMPEGVSGLQAIEALEAAVPSSTVGVNHAYRLQQGETEQGLDYAGQLMGWSAAGCPARVTIGMIDTAIDPTAPELQGAQIEARKFFDGPSADTRHGTDVASILADPKRVTAARIYSADVFGRPETADLVAGAEALVRALDWLADEEVRLVNLALAGPYNRLLELAVERATARGLILIAAVGNEGPEVDPMYPAGFGDVIAVTAIDADRRIYRNAVRGPHVDIAAPGVDVLVSEGRSPRFVTGTSIATPFVTARLAVDPSTASLRTTSQVRELLARTSLELGPEGRDEMFGYGLALADGVCGE